MVRKILLLVAALLLGSAVVLGTGCSQSDDSGQAADPRADWGTFTSTEHDFTLAYPLDWSQQEDIMGAEVAVLSHREGPSDTFRENVNVVVYDLADDPLTLEEFWSQSRDYIRDNLADFVLVESGDSSVDGRPAKRLVFTGTQDARQLKFVQVHVMRNSKVYEITFTSEAAAYAAYVDTADEILDSFDLT